MPKLPGGQGGHWRHVRRLRGWDGAVPIPFQLRCLCSGHGSDQRPFAHTQPLSLPRTTLTLTWDRVYLQRRLSRARGSVRPATRARRRWRMRRCVASPLPRRPRHLAADNALLRSSDGHVTTFAHSLLCLCPHQLRLASQEVRVLVRANFYRANCLCGSSNPIVVTDLRCAGQGCADCVGEQYGTDGLTCQACEPGKHPHIDHTSCDDCSPVRDKPPLLTRRATHLK